MEVSSWPSKDPNEVLDYAFDWSRILDIGETISSATWTLASGITEDSSATSGAITLVFISGGTSGTSYLVTCTIETSLGRTYERSSQLAVASNS